jgi:hypothetical protein
MINHRLLTFDSLGRIRCTLEAVDAAHFNGGTPVKDGLLCLSLLDPENYLGGFGFKSANVCSEQAINPDGNGPIVGRNGQARISDNNPAFWYCGLPFTANSVLSAVIEGLPPVDTGAYNTAYSDAFDVLVP